MTRKKTKKAGEDELKLVQVRVPRSVYDALMSFALLDGDLHVGVYARRVLIDHAQKREDS